jgi:signal transduction histidine kinase
MTWLDISERKAMEEELRTATDRMEQRVVQRTTELGAANAALQREVEKRRMDDQVRAALLRELVSAQEEEQRRISRELHDQLGQSLTGLKFILEALAGSANAAQRAPLGEAVAIVNDLTNRVSTLSIDLRPPALDDLGLVPALLSLITRFTGQTGIQVDFQHSGLDVRLHPDIETVAFRLVQEALTNVARHAETQQARVLVVADSEVTVQIEDQGRGFDPEAGMANHSRGLAGMRERVGLVGGALTIESNSAAGTRIIAQLPKEPAGPQI